MITELIRKALAPSIETLLQEERETMQCIIYGMENALDEMNLIRGSDIADRIDTIERKMDLILKHLGVTPENV